MSNNITSYTEDKGVEVKHPMLASLLMFVLLILALALNLGLVWYERLTRSSPRHTLVNTMAAASAGYNSGLAMSLLIPLIIRTAIMEGGMPITLCRVGAFIVSLCIIQMLLAHAESVCLRYLYTCRLGTVGVIKEGLVQCVLLSANAILGCFFGAVSATVMRENRPAFAYCCGNFTSEFYKNSSLDENMLISDRVIHSSLLTISLAIHVILGWKILIRKRRLAKVNTAQVSNNNKESSNVQSVDATSALFGNVFYMIYVLLPIPVVILGSCMGDAWVAIIRYMCGVAFVYVAPALAYIRNEHIRTVLSRELTAYFVR